MNAEILEFMGFSPSQGMYRVQLNATNSMVVDADTEEIWLCADSVCIKLECMTHRAKVDEIDFICGCLSDTIFETQTQNMLRLTDPATMQRLLKLIPSGLIRSELRAKWRETIGVPDASEYKYKG